MFFNRFFLLLLTLFASLLGVYILTGYLDDAVDPARLLPVDTIAFVDIRNPAAKHKKFRRSKLGRQIHSIKWPEVLRVLDVPEDFSRNFITSSGTLREIFESRLFHELSGRRAVLGLLPMPDPSQQRDLEQDFTSLLVLISRPNHRASLLDLFSTPFISSYEYVTESYLGKEIRTFSLNDEIQVSTAVSDGFFITAFTPGVVKQCLDLSLENLTRGRAGLLGNAEYTSLRQRTQGEDDQFFYLDLKGLANLFHQFPTNTFRAGWFDPVSTLNRLPLKSMSFSRQSNDHTLKYTNILRFNEESAHLRQGQGGRLYPSPTVNSFFREVPASLIAFYWTNMSDFRFFVQGLRSDKRSMAALLIQDFEEFLRSRTGISLDSLLSLLGPEFSVNVSEVWTDGFLPMPKISIRLEVNDRDRVLDVLRGMTEGQLVSTSRFRDVEVHSVQLAGGLIQPSYAFKDGFLIIADSRQQMQIILGSEKRTLLADPLFRSVDVGLTEPNNMIVFVRNRELVDAFKETAVLTGALLSLNAPQGQGFRTRVIIENVVVPVLEGLKMYVAGGARLYSSESELVIESALLLDDR